MLETLSVKVPSAQKARLQALAASRKTTLSRLMIEALEALSQESRTVAPASCYDLTRDLFERPEKLDASPEGDRSTNKGRLVTLGTKARR
jgi:predicted transcriptional regulator